MRKVKQIVIPLTALLLIGTIQEVKAQADWNTLGNTIGGTDFLGTNNNEPLNFKTNGVQRLRITPTGFVGIGTTNPLSLLHLNNTAAASVYSRFTNSTTGTTATDGFVVGIS